MEISLRLAKTEKEKVKLVENHIYTSKKHLSIAVSSIPPFLTDPKCECGEPAISILEDMTCICVKCLNDKMNCLSSLVKNSDISILLTKNTIVRIKFEWSVNDERWYTIYGRSFKPKNWNSFLSKIKDMILNNRVITMNAEYTKETKEMMVY